MNQCVSLFTFPSLSHTDAFWNSGILDAFWLARTLTSIIKGESPEATKALSKYEETICKRRQFSTPLSRQATVDGHKIPPPDSPLVNVYKIPTEELDRAMEICEEELSMKA